MNVNITTIIELENAEVEKIIGAQLVYEHEQIFTDIVHTCVSGLVDQQTQAKIEIDDAMERLFHHLQQENIVTGDVEEFSYELPSCERMKEHMNDDLPSKVTLSFVAQK